MAIELLVILVGVIVVGAAAGFFLLRGLLRKRPRDRRRDPNAQTKCGATPPHRAAPARPETKSKRGKKRKRNKKADAEDHAEAQEEEGHAEAHARDDDNVNELNAELRWAAQNGDIKTAANLIDAGADPNAELQSAARRGDTKAVTTLLNAGADPNALDLGGRIDSDMTCPDPDCCGDLQWEFGYRYLRCEDCGETYAADEIDD